MRVIGDAVQRHPAAQAKIGEARLALQRPRRVHQYVFQDKLNAGGAIGEAAAFGGPEVDRFERIAGRPEQIDEFCGERPLGRGVKIEIVQIEPEGAVRRPPDHLANRIGHGRAAIG